MNAAGVEMFYSIFKLFPDREQWMASTTPERIAELDAIEALRKQEEENEKEKAANVSGYLPISFVLNCCKICNG